MINAVAPDATAFPHREAAYKAAWSIWWTDPAAEADSLRWMREFYHGVHAATGGVPVIDDVTDGCYVYYPDIDLREPKCTTSDVPWYELYYKGNYAKLQQIKKTYAPRNFSAGEYRSALSTVRCGQGSRAGSRPRTRSTAADSGKSEPPPK
ncbi:hypothetical protein G9272_24635 [Streptomyces asoensis]|uniref:Berberine/berberine-like domain-containing protein n=1 Tax=Streptomyces asoensis TaxID=249586 RepID=A0A6M4WSC7_9ACTN|nr:BBE domain-containing protein [Streptomyces asoensis]QJT03079.1 hypothetical protein G9272_24635 [Streptomyces asoensis]